MSSDGKWLAGAALVVSVFTSVGFYKACEFREREAARRYRCVTPTQTFEHVQVGYTSHGSWLLIQDNGLEIRGSGPLSCTEILP
jgi:hypothetical protein